MNADYVPTRIEPGPRRRHETRVQQFSRDPSLLLGLDGLAASDVEVPDLALAVCSSFGVEAPALKFHARRSPYTGVTEQPRWLLAELHGDRKVEELERTQRSTLPVFGAIRLGRTTTLMTLAHELGHHLVFSLEPPRTPAHGRAWVGRFDDSAYALDRLIRGLGSPSTGSLT